MLVLSRQKSQRINFPGLGITVEIIDVKGSKVKVGVDAPIEVRILRDELIDRGESPHADQPQLGETQHGEPQPGEAQHIVRLPQALRHDLRNALHELSLMLHVYRKRTEQAASRDDRAPMDPEQMFEAIVERLENLSGHRALSRVGAIPASRGSNARALVVDDDANERELLAGFLRMCDYEADTASDGLNALAYLEENEPPRVILLDMNMPRCDGQAFLQRVRRVGAWDPIHVFIVSGSDPKELGLHPADGYTHWFQKPLDPRRVVERLAEIEAETLSVA